MEALGVLAGGIAHEFNNILYVLMGYAELAQMRASAGRPVDRQLEEILHAVARARELVDQVFSLTRSEEEEPRPILIQPTVKETGKLLRAALPATVEVRHHVDETCGRVVADPTQIYHLLMALAVSGQRSLGDGGGVIEVRLEPWRGEVTFEPPPVPGEHLHLLVRVAVVDPSRQLAEPAVAPPAWAEEVIAGVGGRIAVRHRPATGTEVHLVLPLVDEEPGTAGEDLQAVPGGDERVLCVSGDEQVLAVQHEVLSALGYRVEGVASSQQALDFLRQDPGGVDLVILERAVPGMTGARLAVELHRIRADLPVIVAAARTTELSGKGSVLELVRPASASQLARAVRRALDGGRCAPEAADEEPP